MARPPRNRSHFFLDGGGQAEPYTSPRTVISGLPPARARAQHAAKLSQSLATAIAGAQQTMAAREPGIAEGDRGFYLQFEVPAAERGAVDALENKPAGIELVAVPQVAAGEESITATVFVPERSLEFYSKKIDAYRTEQTKTGRPKNEALIARIEDVHLAAVRSLFTDASELYPQPNAAAWWEVWIRDGRLASFRIVAGRLNIPLKDHAIRFPERDVVLAHGTEATIARVVSNSDAIAELRLAKDTPSIFLEMGAPEQVEWAEDLVGRLVAPDMLAPAICLLDSGATRQHPLIAPALPADNQHAYDDNWGGGR